MKSISGNYRAYIINHLPLRLDIVQRCNCLSQHLKPGDCHFILIRLEMLFKAGGFISTNQSPAHVVQGGQRN
jgi:hypothetical protein